MWKKRKKEKGIGDCIGTSSSVVVYGLIRFAWRQAICCGSLSILSSSFHLLCFSRKKEKKMPAWKKNKILQQGDSVILFNRMFFSLNSFACFLLPCSSWNFSSLSRWAWRFKWPQDNLHQPLSYSLSLVGTAPFEPASAASFKTFKGDGGFTESFNYGYQPKRERERVELWK